MRFLFFNAGFYNNHPTPLPIFDFGLKYMY
jgi:hypothetical protein